MADIHPRIVEKLEEYPKEVRDLALKAVELSATQTEAAVVEMLRPLSREVLRAKANR